MHLKRNLTNDSIPKSEFLSEGAAAVRYEQFLSARNSELRIKYWSDPLFTHTHQSLICDPWLNACIALGCSVTFGLFGEDLPRQQIIECSLQFALIRGRQNQPARIFHRIEFFRVNIESHEVN